MNLIQALVNAIRLPRAPQQDPVHGGILIIFRPLRQRAVPGAKQSHSTRCSTSRRCSGLLDLFSGGGLSRFSVVAMGNEPLHQRHDHHAADEVISERIKEIQKEGETGRRRIQRWSRYLTVRARRGPGLTASRFSSRTPTLRSSRCSIGSSS